MRHILIMALAALCLLGAPPLATFAQSHKSSPPTFNKIQILSTMSGFVLERDAIFADVNGDQQIDVVMPSVVEDTINNMVWRGVRAYNITGPSATPLWHDLTNEAWNSPDGGGALDLLAGDMDGDGNWEFLRQGGSQQSDGSIQHQLMVWDRFGLPFPTVPFDAKSFSSSQQVKNVQCGNVVLARLCPKDRRQAVICGGLQQYLGNIKKDYRFFLFGDAFLFINNPNNQNNPQLISTVIPAPISKTGKAPSFFGNFAVGNIDQEPKLEFVFHARDISDHNATYYYLMRARDNQNGGSTYAHWPIKSLTGTNGLVFDYGEPFSIANVDNNPKSLEMVTLSSNPSATPAIVTLNALGELLEQPFSNLAPLTLKQVGLTGQGYGEPLFIDTDQDQRFELLVQTVVPQTQAPHRKQLHLMRYANKAWSDAPNWPVEIESFGAAWDPMVVGNLDNDSTPDVLVASRSAIGDRILLHAFRGSDAQPIFTTPLTVPLDNAGQLFTLALVDGLTNPNLYDIVVTVSQNTGIPQPFVKIYHAPTYGVPARLIQNGHDWPVYRHDYTRSGNARYHE